MTRQDAYKLLNIDKNDSFKDVRRKYHMLMHKHHPDTKSHKNDSDSEMASLLNSAFELIKRDGLSDVGCSYVDLGFKENDNAFCKRKMYMKDSLFGDDIIVDTGLYGRYYWEPDLESFDIFLKSINEAASELIKDLRAFSVSKKAKLLHLLIQQFIDPYECISLLYPGGKYNAQKEFCCQVNCHIKPEGESAKKISDNTLTISPADSRLYLYSDSTRIGQIDFDENYLYYVITPFFIQETVHYEIQLNTPKSLTRSKYYYPAVISICVDPFGKRDVTGRINLEIASLLQ